MVKIRLQRGGAKGHAHYRIVAIDERSSGRGRALQFLGTYDPNLNPARVRLDAEAIQAWVAKGAQLSDTVRSLLKRGAAEAPARTGAA
jgi:small subunit ribosomal protein S16